MRKKMKRAENKDERWSGGGREEWGRGSEGKGGVDGEKGCRGGWGRRVRLGKGGGR